MRPAKWARLAAAAVAVAAASSSGLSSLPATAASGTIKGVVFEDVNQNGLRNPDEVGVAGIEVTATDASGTTTPAVATAADGTYTIDLAPLSTAAGDVFRVQFLIPSRLSRLRPAPVGVVGDEAAVRNVSSVRFSRATGEGESVDFAVAAPADYCQPDAPLAVACFFGDASGDPNTIVSFTSDSEQLANVARRSQTGAVWGLAHHRPSGRLFAAAFAKRHAAFGPGGPGAIYTVDPTTGATETLISLPAGTDAHDARLDRDFAMWNAVGRTSLGDIDATEDGSTLYAWNLFDRRLYVISPGAAPGAGTGTVIASLAMPDPGAGADGCPRDPATPAGQANRNVVPGALAVHDGTVYVGLTCTAAAVAGSTNSSTRAAPNAPNPDALLRRQYLRGFVFRLDGSGFTRVASFPLGDHERGCAARASGVCGSSPTHGLARWLPWAAAATQMEIENTQLGPTGVDFNVVLYPQPWLTDIDFDDRGFMLVGVTDRFGHQSGSLRSGTGTFEGASAGDVLRLSPSEGGFRIENNGSDGTRTTAGAGNGEGHGGGEFYYQDDYPNTTNPSNHDQTADGALLARPGTGEVVATVFDPERDFRTGGVLFLDADQGHRVDSFQIFGPVPGSFGKAVGLGDMEGLCTSAPVQIGNRVWLDDDADGVQDPNEQPLAGVRVRLLDTGGREVTTVRTAADGTWAIPIQPGVAYALEWEPSSVTNLPGGISTSELAPTGTTQGTDRALDSDATTAGRRRYRAEVAPHAPGENDHTFDAGFFAGPSPAARTEPPLPVTGDEDAPVEKAPATGRLPRTGSAIEAFLVPAAAFLVVGHWLAVARHARALRRAPASLTRRSSQR